jgi:hypothetical protein
VAIEGLNNDLLLQKVAGLHQAQIKKRINKAKEGAIAMRQLLWPEITESELWLLSDRTTKGFSQLPRTMPILMNIIAEASKKVGKKSVPAGKSYLALWCRAFDEGVVKIDNEMAAAYEAGYAGERALSTWREHLRVLKDLGFVDYRASAGGPMQFVLLLNPYQVVRKLRTKGWIDDLTFVKLAQRAVEIGAGKDLGVGLGVGVDGNAVVVLETEG